MHILSTGVPQEGPHELNGHLAAQSNGVDAAENPADAGGRQGVPTNHFIIHDFPFLIFLKIQH